MTGETPEVRSDKREPKMAAMSAMAAMADMVAMAAMPAIAAMAAMTAMAASICIQILKRKAMYIGRNAQNLKKWPRTYILL